MTIDDASQPRVNTGAQKSPRSLSRPAAHSSESIKRFVRKRTAEINNRLNSKFAEISNDSLQVQSGPWCHILSRPEEVFDAYPTIFSPAFNHIPEEHLRELSLAFRLGFEHMNFSDSMFDSHDSISPVTVLWKSLYEHECVMQFMKLFDAGSPFWKHYRKYLERHSQALFIEILQVRHRLNPLSLEQFEAASAGKIAIGRLMIPAMALLDTGEASFKIANKLQKCHDDLWHAIHIIDDLVDWLEDLERGRFSFVIWRAVEKLGMPLSECRRVKFSEVAIQDALVSGGVASTCLRTAEGYLRRANRAAKTEELVDCQRLISCFHGGISLMSTDLANLKDGESLVFPSFHVA